MKLTLLLVVVYWFCFLVFNGSIVVLKDSGIYHLIYDSSFVSWLMPTISALGKLRQEANHEFEGSLDQIVSFRPVCVTA